MSVAPTTKPRTGDQPDADTTPTASRSTITRTAINVLATPGPTWLRSGWQRLLELVASHAILIVLGIVFLLPFFWMVTTSVKTIAGINTFPVEWFPEEITFSNYVNGLQVFPFARYFLNTMIICVASMIGAVLSSSFIAYGLACIDWGGSKIVFVAMLATMMIPFYVTMVPLFSMYREMGWSNTYLPLIVPHFFGGAFFVFLLRQFFRGIPRDLLDAARVDGAGELRIWAMIVMPLAKPALAAVALFQFLASWGDLLGPLIYLSDSDLYTLSLGLTYYSSQYSTQFGPLMAASTVILIPVIILFFLAQRTFIQGITLTGVKG